MKNIKTYYLIVLLLTTNLIATHKQSPPKKLSESDKSRANLTSMRVEKLVEQVFADNAQEFTIKQEELLKNIIAILNNKFTIKKEYITADLFNVLYKKNTFRGKKFQTHLQKLLNIKIAQTKLRILTNNIDTFRTIVANLYNYDSEYLSKNYAEIMVQSQIDLIYLSTPDIDLNWLKNNYALFALMPTEIIDSYSNGLSYKNNLELIPELENYVSKHKYSSYNFVSELLKKLFPTQLQKGAHFTKDKKAITSYFKIQCKNKDLADLLTQIRYSILSKHNLDAVTIMQYIGTRKIVKKTLTTNTHNSNYNTTPPQKSPSIDKKKKQQIANQQETIPKESSAQSKLNLAIDSVKKAKQHELKTKEEAQQTRKELIEANRRAFKKRKNAKQERVNAEKLVELAQQELEEEKILIEKQRIANLMNIGETLQTDHSEFYNQSGDKFLIFYLSHSRNNNLKDQLLKGSLQNYASFITNIHKSNFAEGYGLNFYYYLFHENANVVLKLAAETYNETTNYKNKINFSQELIDDMRQVTLERLNISQEDQRIKIIQADCEKALISL